MFRLKRKNRKGYILVEAVLALAIIAISLVSVFGVKSYIARRKKIDLQNMKDINYMEALKNKIYYNETYTDFRSQLNNKVYITKENIKMDVLKDKEFNQIFISQEPSELPYISIDVSEAGNVLKIIINMRTEYKNLTTTLYKGD